MCSPYLFREQTGRLTRSIRVNAACVSLLDMIQSTSVRWSDLLRLKRLWKRVRRQQKIRRRAKVSPCRVVIGASGKVPQGWIHTEIEDVNLLVSSSWERFFERASIEAILAEHVWEHLTLEEGLQAARVCHRFLCVGGYLRIAVPDGFHPDPRYIEGVRPHGNGPGCDDHKVLYTHDSLSQLLEQVGFRVALLEHFDRQGQFHYREWNSEDGLIRRSRRFDARNQNRELAYTSVILDAKKV